MLQTFSLDEHLIAELRAAVVSGERSRFVAHAIRRALNELYEVQERPAPGGRRATSPADDPPGAT